MTEDLDERVLNGFVGFGGIAQILKRDSQSAALMGCDEAFEPLPGRLEVALFDKTPDLDGELGVL
jgi:hypothetical protein